MLDSHDGEVHRHAERQRDELPEQRIQQPIETREPHLADIEWTFAQQPVPCDNVEGAEHRGTDPRCRNEHPRAEAHAFR